VQQRGRAEGLEAIKHGGGGARPARRGVVQARSHVVAEAVSCGRAAADQRAQLMLQAGRAGRRPERRVQGSGGAA
jgi:hypothetical protein